MFENCGSTSIIFVTSRQASFPIPAVKTTHTLRIFYNDMYLKMIPRVHCTTPNMASYQLLHVFVSELDSVFLCVILKKATNLVNFISETAD